MQVDVKPHSDLIGLGRYSLIPHQDIRTLFSTMKLWIFFLDFMFFNFFSSNIASRRVGLGAHQTIFHGPLFRVYFS
jgi:hypothetical protein